MVTFIDRKTHAEKVPRESAAPTVRRILVVDDNAIIQDILKQLLSARYVVVSASNASQALAAIIRHTPSVMLLDVKMPGVDGLSLLRSLREMGVQTPIFVMTGYDSLDVAREALNAGANAYLPKPFDLLYLDRLIADALGAEPALQAS